MNRGLVIEEGPGRRLQELEMLHFYITRTGPDTSFEQDGPLRTFWVSIIPQIAVKSEALLYALFSFVHLHRAEIVRRVPLPFTVTRALQVTRQQDQHRVYLQLALKYHAEQIAEPSHTNADSITAQAMLLRTISFAHLADRELSPYTPPIQWLQMIASQTKLFQVTASLTEHSPNAPTATLMRFIPRATTTNLTSPIARWLLSADSGLDHEGQVDTPRLPENATQGAYLWAVDYLELVAEMLAEGRPIGGIGRRLTLFPHLVPLPFIQCIAEYRPRALAILLFYFGLLQALRSFWFVGSCAEREANALMKHMQWEIKMEQLLAYTSLLRENYSKSVPGEQYYPEVSRRV